MSGRRSHGSHWEDWIEPGRPAEPSSPADAPEPDPWTYLEPLFPVASFGPLSQCPHRGPLKEGSSFVCMVCHAAGKDGTKALPLDVKPLPVEPKPAEVEERPRTRKQKRAAKERHRAGSAS